MEEVLLRFPHLKENIFNALDNHTFAICKEVSKVWYNNLDDRKRKVKVIKKLKSANRFFITDISDITDISPLLLIQLQSKQF